MRALIERFAASPPERKAWGIIIALVALGLAVWGLSLLRRPVMWPVTLLAIGVGSGIAVLGVAHEIFRKRWGTWGILALGGLIIAFNLALLLSGRPATSSLLKVAFCLAGCAAFWFDLPDRNDAWVVPGEAKKYTGKAEEVLKAVTPATPFHAAIGRDLLAQAEPAAEWLMSIYDEAAAQMRVRALYVEMNRFDINTDRWYLEAGAYDIRPGSMFGDLEGNLGEYEFFSEREFTLTGTDDLQRAFAEAGEAVHADVAGKGDSGLAYQMMGITFDVITGRMQELVAAAHRLADKRGHPVGRVRVFANAHDATWPVLCSPPRLM